MKTLITAILLTASLSAQAELLTEEDYLYKMKLAASGTYCEQSSTNAWRKMNHRASSDSIIENILKAGINHNNLIADMDFYIEKMGKFSAHDIEQICKIIMEKNA